jgi:butyryl-CoA dehydrogenase
MALMKDLTEALSKKKNAISKEAFLADSVLYLELVSIITIAWQWLKQMNVAVDALKSSTLEHDKRFYQGKIYTGQYFFDYELVKIYSLDQRLRSDDRVTVDITKEFFED